MSRADQPEQLRLDLRPARPRPTVEQLRATLPPWPAVDDDQDDDDPGFGHAK
jgi:hypothetical protein